MKAKITEDEIQQLEATVAQEAERSTSTTIELGKRLLALRAGLPTVRHFTAFLKQNGIPRSRAYYAMARARGDKNPATPRQQLINEFSADFRAMYRAFEEADEAGFEREWQKIFKLFDR